MFRMVLVEYVKENKVMSDKVKSDKVKLTLSIEKELVDLAKQSNMNISEFVEQQLAVNFKIRKEVRWVSIV